MKSSHKQRGKAYIVVMVIDAGRADRFSCYGHYRKTTPNIDLLAEQGLIFEGAYTVDMASLLIYFALIIGQSDWNGRACLNRDNWLEENQQVDNTVFFILSDHGEPAGEEGFFTHSQKPAEYQMRIPLMVSGAKYINRARRIFDRLSIVDIRANIFDLVGVDDPFKHRSGESLFTERKDSFSAGDKQQSNPWADRSSQLMGGKREEFSENELVLMEESLRDLGNLD